MISQDCPNFVNLKGVVSQCVFMFEFTNSLSTEVHNVNLIITK